MGYNEKWILITGAMAGLGVLLTVAALILIVLVLIFLSSLGGG